MVSANVSFLKCDPWGKNTCSRLSRRNRTSLVAPATAVSVCVCDGACAVCAGRT